MSSPPDLPSHVQRIVDEIETEIGDTPSRPAELIEGTGATEDRGDNLRVEQAVRQILLEIGEEPDREGLAGSADGVS